MVRGALVVSWLAACSAAAVAQSNAEPRSKIVPGAYIVEFEDGHDPNDIHKAYESHAVKRRDLDYSLFKGASIHFRDVSKSEEQAAELGALPGVKAIFPVEQYDAPDDEVIWTGNPDRDYRSNRKRQVLGSEAKEETWGFSGLKRRFTGWPENPEDDIWPSDEDADARHLRKRQSGVPDHDEFTPHFMTQVERLRDRGYTGKNLKVAVIDSGIDYTHPALGGCFGKDCLVSYGKDYVNEDIPGVSNPKGPMDCNGHGTHVAGTIAAQSNPFGFTGASPDVKLGAYKVLPCNDGVSTDTLVASFNQAYDDGSDIICASIGGPNGWSSAPWAATVKRIVEKGVPCAIAAGNDGETGMFFASSGSSGIGAMSVGSFDNIVTPELLTEAAYTIGSSGGSRTDFGYHPGSPARWADVDLPIWATSYDHTIADDACDPLPSNTPDLSGYIMLVRRGTCNLDVKARNVAARGAKYVMFYNNVPGIANSKAEINGINAIGMTTAEVGELLVKTLAGGTGARLHMSDPLQSNRLLDLAFNNATGNFASTFTTWGPTWEGHVKPQFSAPGGQILSTYPRTKGSYAVLSGTSMATPLVAGVTALISEARKTLDPIAITNLLAATSRPQKFNDGKRSYDFYAPVAQQGAGLIQAFDAAFSKSFPSISSIAFNDTDNFSAERKFKVKNLGDKPITYKLQHYPAATAFTFASNQKIPAKFPNELSTQYASIKFDSDSVTAQPGKEVEIKLTATPPSGLDKSRLPVWSGYIVLRGDDDIALSIPYQGIAGSLHDTTVLASAASTAYQDKKGTRLTGNEQFVLKAPGKANFNTDRLPAVAIQLAMGTEFLYIDIMPEGGNVDSNLIKENLGTKTIGSVSNMPARFLSRLPEHVPWDGRLNDGKYAPAGKYKFSVKALRIFGKPNEPKDYDMIETVPFEIRYESSS